MAFPRIVLPAGVTAGTFRLRTHLGKAATTYSSAAGAGASTDWQPIGTVRYAPPGSYVLENDAAGVVTHYTLHHDGPDSAPTIAARLAAVERTHYAQEGEGPFPRFAITSPAVGIASGTMRLCYFEALRTETVGRLVAANGQTAAGLTPTLVRLGMYRENADGSLDLLAATANDTTIFSAANALYTREVTAPAEKVRGQRYALAVLIVSVATMPQLTGIAAGAGAAIVLGAAPRVSGLVNNLTDLPDSVANGSVGHSGNLPYMECRP